MPKKDPKGAEQAQNIVKGFLVSGATAPKTPSPEKPESDIRLVEKKTKPAIKKAAPPLVTAVEHPQYDADFVIPFRCNRLLHDEIKQYIEKRHQAMDYRFSGVSDLFRSALQAYIDGMKVTEGVVKSKAKKISTTFRVSQGMYEFYKRLPDRHKTAILERVIRTYYSAL